MALRGARLTAAIRLFASGMSMRQVARVLGVKLADVQKAIRRAL